MNYHPAIPTLGYPSKKAAIIALYEQRVMATTIAAQVGSTANAVHRAICDYRGKTGRNIAPIRPEKTQAPVEPPLQPSNVWARNDNDRREIFHRRAARAARLARMAAQ